MKLRLPFLLSVFFLFFLSFASGVIHAKELKNQIDTKALADKMVGHFIKKEFTEGMAVAKPHWPLPKVELDNLIKTIEKQWPIVDQRFGQAVGLEMVSKEKIGDSFLRYYYLHKFNNHAIYWKITFYKPEKNWVVNGVSFKDNLDILYK
ncbi:hypothetical protein GCM10009133_01920 [Cocleimonas flava]|nr:MULTISPECIES: hypothetical protein [unclassified Cocleimonas]MEB8433524.1 hypothetical protein [Cocleimonas sp. KMM 6892]MEC4716335.1 hypothetical protein [Cocleimonas sp. KMM 6895]MEC4745772.1 hypothetical protein [Cocleimonas sp. KMM 6896]